MSSGQDGKPLNRKFLVACKLVIYQVPNLQVPYHYAKMVRLCLGSVAILATKKLRFRGFPSCPLDVLASCEPAFSQRYCCPPLSGLSVFITVAQCGATLTRWRLLPAPNTAGCRSLIAAYCRGYRSSGQPGKTRKRWRVSVRPARPLRAVRLLLI
jgi:hypothetical protein